MPPILFQPFDKTIPADGRRSLLELARALGLPLQAACGGKKICGKCKVRIESPEGSLQEPSDRELEVLGDLTEKGFRLACETILTSGALVHIPEESLIQQPVILRADPFSSFKTPLRPQCDQLFLEVPPAVLGNVTADRERVGQALRDTYGIKSVTFDPLILQKLPQILRSDKKGITMSLWNNEEVIGLFPGREKRLVGLALDIGTTTVVGYLIDLQKGTTLSVASALNPQIAYGDDLISRISFCLQQEKGLEQIRQAILDGLGDLIARAAKEAGINPELIIEAAVVGNTAMHHFFLGLDIRYLARAPYTPVLQAGQFFKARDLGLNINPSAYVHLLPLKAGFVGSDVVAGVLATGLHKSRTVSLFIDLGTNGEIVLGNRKGLICCSTAAGPAFEGGHLRWGMRASAGAIERVAIDRNTWEVTWKTIDRQPPIGICGSGIISALAEMIRTGIILAKGDFNPACATARLRAGAEGSEFVLAWSWESSLEQDIVITRKDVAEVQMAKAAIQAGAVLLKELLGGEPIKRILLAGAFGNYCDPEDARTIGLFPDCPAAVIKRVGHTAGSGAALCLLNKSKKKEAEGIAQKMTYLELAAHPRFQDLFISGMFFSAAKDFQDFY